MAMHKLGYTGEKLSTALKEGMRDKQKGHEKLAHTKDEKMENIRNDVFIELDLMEVEGDTVDETNHLQSHKIKKVTAEVSFWKVD